MSDSIDRQTDRQTVLSLHLQIQEGTRGRSTTKNKCINDQMRVHARPSCYAQVSREADRLALYVRAFKSNEKRKQYKPILE